jgi:hypothetical protein
LEKIPLAVFAACYGWKGTNNGVVEGDVAGEGEAAEDAREVWHLTMRWCSPRLARVGFWRVRMEKRVCRTKSAKIRLPTIEKVQAKRWEHRRGIH